MVWKITYLPQVQDDLKKLGRPGVRRARTAIENKLRDGDPNRYGKPLRNVLAGYRSLRVGDLRIIYRVYDEEIRVLIVAVGPRRNDEIYKVVRGRVE